MERNINDKSDKSLVDSSEEETEIQGGGYFTSEQKNLNKFTTPYTNLPQKTQHTSKQSYTASEEETLINTNPEADMISFANYYKKFMRDPGIEGRKASRLLFLRSFNNWIKAVLINKYTYNLGKDLSILDLCCGRGGDLEKYFRGKVKLYVGADLSEESLKNAIDRIIKLKSEKFKNLQTKCFFITEDISDPNNNLLKKIPEEFIFDFVSCQFAMHYHFESEINVRTFLENVTTRLNEGGCFVGTIIDSNTLIKRLRNRKNLGNKYINEKYTFGNDFYSVKFYQKRFPKENGPYGIKYGFYLEDSIDKRDEFGKIKYVGEYLVIFENFVELCKEYDLHLIERKNFTEYYEDNIDNKYFRNLFRKMIKEIHVTSKEAQWEIIQLYQIFAFRKGKAKEPGNNRSYNPAMKKSKRDFKDYDPIFIEDKFE